MSSRCLLFIYLGLHTDYISAFTFLFTASHNHIYGSPGRLASELGPENLLIYKTVFCS